MSSSVVSLNAGMLSFSNSSKAKMSWDSWLAAVLSSNGRHSDLTQNELTYLRKRHEEGKKPTEIFI